MGLQLDPCKPTSILTLILSFPRTVGLMVTRKSKALENEEGSKWIRRISWRGHCGRELRVLPELGELNTVNRDAVFCCLFCFFLFLFYPDHATTIKRNTFKSNIDLSLLTQCIWNPMIHILEVLSIIILMSSCSPSNMLNFHFVMELYLFLALITNSCPSVCIYLTSSALSN